MWRGHVSCVDRLGMGAFVDEAFGFPMPQFFGGFYNSLFLFLLLFPHTIFLLLSFCNSLLLQARAF